MDGKVGGQVAGNFAAWTIWPPTTANYGLRLNIKSMKELWTEKLAAKWPASSLGSAYAPLGRQL
jgi:hypothetical protein